MRRFLVLALLLLGGVPSGAWGQRLPAGAAPLHYAITLSPDLARERFEGRETIDVRLDEPTARLTLNAVDLDIRDAVVVVGRDRRLRASISYNDRAGQVALGLDERVPAGVVKLEISFAGVLNRELRGLYLSEANGRKYAATQFEATDARRAFPCFDEPAMKASFAISAVVAAGDTAISNAPPLTDTPGPGPGRHTIRFGTTPKMSTYLVALAVGDFTCLEGKSAEFPIRVCATPDKTAAGRFALEAATEFLAFYNAYFTLRYPFRKLDLVAIPDFSAGAMENTGAIFFREQDLLIDGDAAPVSSRYEVAAVIAHEMAHQWFGDLVTMKWWDDVWLNEGFATWMESKPVLAWKPGWHAELAEVRSAGRAMEVDSLRAARPLRSPVSTPAEIDEAFDAIAYDKGAAVLRMVEGYVGPEAFRAGVNAYIRRFAYASASADDFWTEMAAATGKPIDRLLPAFVDRPGLPLVTTASRCEGTGRTVTRLSQGRFLLDAPPGAAPSTPWPIPVELRGLEAASPSADLQPALLDAPDSSVSLAGCAGVVFANAGARGYYRAAYSKEALERLAAAGPRLLTTAERLRLVDDEWALVRAGIHPIAGYLELVEAFAADPAAAVIDSLGASLAFVHDYLLTDEDRPLYEAWVRRVFRARAEELGAPSWTPLPSDDGNRRELRAAVMRLLATAGRDEEVLGRARVLLEEGVGRGDVDPELLPTLASLAALTADTEMYGRLSAARRSGAPLDGDAVLLEALTHAARPEMVSHALELAASNRVRSQDTAVVLAALLANPAANGTAWAFIKSRWRPLEKKMRGLLAEPELVAATSSFCDPAMRDDVRQFFEDRAPRARRALAQALERIDNCVSMRRRDTPLVAAWLRGRVKFSKTGTTNDDSVMTARQ